MINLATEKLISFAEAARRLPNRGGKAVNPSTIWRWAKNGCTANDGSEVKLESLRLGGRHVTSVEALQRFAEAVSGQPIDVAKPARTPTRRQQASERAGRELQKAGI